MWKYTIIIINKDCFSMIVLIYMQFYRIIIIRMILGRFWITDRYIHIGDALSAVVKLGAVTRDRVHFILLVSTKLLTWWVAGWRSSLWRSLGVGLGCGTCCRCQGCGGPSKYWQLLTIIFKLVSFSSCILTSRKLNYFNKSFSTKNNFSFIFGTSK